MIEKFWSGKTVLVTGHTGFKGSWLCLWLQQMGANVIGYALAPPTSPSLFEIARVSEGITSIEGDIRDLDFLQSVILEYKPEIIFHMAAQSLVQYSYINPVETYSTNVMGTVNLLEAARKTDNLKVIVNITSDKCYQNNEWDWGYRENEPMGGYDPYSNSKGCAELVTAAYRDSYFNTNDFDDHGVAIASVRAGNVIGGGDWAADRLIPDFVRSILEEKEIVIRSPKAIRPWQHVLEPLCGYLSLAEKMWEQGPDYAEAWNFGPNDDDAKTVEWIAERMTKLWGNGASWKLNDRVFSHEANYLKLDTSKVRNRLNWEPRWHVEYTLETIVEWYRAWMNGKDMRKSTLAQIQRYQTT